MKHFITYLLCFLLTSCTKIDDENKQTQGPLRLSFSVDVANSQTSNSKANYFDTREDSAIKRLRLFLFTQDGVSVENVNLDKFIEGQNGVLDINQTFYNCLPGNYFIVLVANWNISDMQADSFGTYSELMCCEIESKSNSTYGVDTPLVMTSDKVSLFFNYNDVRMSAVSLKRIASRIGIKFENTLNSIQYIRIKGSAQSTSLSGSTTGDEFVLFDENVGLDGSVENNTAYYYIYPNGSTPTVVSVRIDGTERIITLPNGIESNMTYQLKLNYTTVVEDVSFDKQFTGYDAKNSEFSVKGTGDVIELTTIANCIVEQSPNDWLSISTLTKSSSLYQIRVANNPATPSRSATVTIRDADNNVAPKRFTITQSQSKYMVVAVGGQSNACGADESAVYLDGVHKTNPRTVQLSYRRGVKQANLDVVPLTWCIDDMYDLTYIKNASGLQGAKGIHQPLALQLLEKLSTTHSDYDIMIVPAGFSGTAFTVGNTTDAYNSVEMHPSNMSQSARMRWGKEKAFARTMVDRIKYVMDMNVENKLIGIVWCQGESDRTNYRLHNQLFEEMTSDIFDKLNNAGIGMRTSKGIVDKDSWYVFTSAIYYMDYYLSSSAAQVFAGYKTWNPNTFVYIEPKNEYTNLVGGNGAASTARSSHYGNDSYRTVVAPKVIACMDDNGSLFNGNTPKRDRFYDTTTPTQASLDGGNLSDEDIVSNLIVHMPFSLTVQQELVGTATVTVNGDAQTAPSIDNLPIDINRSPRSINALMLDSKGKGITISGLANTNSLSVSLMLRRTTDLDANVQRILTFLGSSNTSVLEYKAITNSTLRRPELMFEPVLTATASATVVAQFSDAVTVRSEQEWCHVFVTHDANTKTTNFYLNGFLINSRTMPSLNNVNFNQIVVGENASITTGVRGEISNLMVWNRALSSTTARKLFLLNYYGFSK